MRALFAGRVRQIPTWAQNTEAALRSAPVLVVPDTPAIREALGITPADETPAPRARPRQPAVPARP